MKSLSMLPSQFVSDRQHDDAAWNELRPVLHDEVRRLPEKYRVPVILSYLEGKTNEEVAELLQWPVGTVEGRLSRARALLRSRLTRRGITLSAAFLSTALADGAIFAEVVPAELVERTMILVKRFKTHSGLPGSTRPPDRASTESRFPKQLRATIDALPKDTKFILLLMVVLIFLLSISTVIGIGLAVGGGITPKSPFT
jgi:Sigma-70, region 4